LDITSYSLIWEFSSGMGVSGEAKNGRLKRIFHPSIPNKQYSDTKPSYIIAKLLKPMSNCLKEQDCIESNHQMYTYYYILYTHLMRYVLDIYVLIPN